MDLVEVMGKQNRKVPVLLTPNVKTAIDLLNDTREKSGVCADNKYVFAKVRFMQSLNCTNKSKNGQGHS